MMSYGSVSVCREKGVKCGSLRNKGTRFAPISVTTDSSRCLGGGLRCLALTSISRRLLRRRNDMRGGEGNAPLHHCEERRMFELLKMIRRMLGRAGLNVTTNGILLDSFFKNVSRAWLWEI